MTAAQGPVDVDVDVLVVGAGPTGLTLAIELLSYGVSFRIVDRNPDQVHESRALAIQPRTLEVLRRHGLAQPLVDAGNPAVQLRMHVGRRIASVALFDIGIADTAYPYLLFLSQAETERILGDHLARHRVVVERDAELTALDQTGHAVTCQVRHGDGHVETVTARYVVGCDGAGSTVRRQAGIGFEGHAYPQTFLLADLDADGLEQDAVHAVMSQSGMMFFFPLGRPATWRMLAMRAPTDPDTPVTLDLLQTIADRYAGGGIRLRDPVWMTAFKLHNRGATTYRTGRVLLAGDAAHIHSPAGAQGMNTGIQDAVNLGWKLALTLRGSRQPALLDTYDSERAPVGRMVLRFTDRAFSVATSSNPLLRSARTRVAPHLAPLALRARRPRAYAFHTIAQLGIRYPRSPLSADNRSRWLPGPRPGDRLPDAPVVVDGQPGRLHDILSTPGFHLLLCGPSSTWTTAFDELRECRAGVHRLSRDSGPAVLRDPDGTALRRLGVRASPRSYLVRPDGHIALRQLGTDLAGVCAYLDRWLPPQSDGPAGAA